jgi:putative ABC transport system permease protein
LFLLSAVGVVMLGACANVANLLLIKAAASRKEVAVKSALGASRMRLIAQMLTESLLLGGIGTVLGIGLAYAGIKAFVAIGPPEIPLLADARIDGPVLAFAVAAMLLTVILVGVLPAVRSTRPDASAVLRQSATRVLRVDDRRLMRALSVAQIALAMVLLTTGGLLVRSFQALLRVDPGFRTDRILSFQLELPMGAGMPYAEQDRRDVFFATLRHELSGLPGVRGTTIASAPPLEEEPSAIPLTLSGSADDRSFRANFRMVAHDYFGLLGIPMLRGRLLAPGDVRSGPPVVVVSASLARTIWGNADPIGQRLARSGSEGDAEVVGVVGDVRTSGLDGEAARIVYVPASQGQYNFATLLVRTTNDPAALVPAVRHLAKNLDASLPLHHVRTLDSMLAESVAQQRFQLLVIGTISLLMFALAVIGTYGVSAYGVSERTNELGIRAALGATTGHIRRLVLGEGARMTLLGIGIGTLVTIALNRVLTRFVFGISSLDVVAFLTAPALLALAALIAIAIPAHRAARADPMQALKSE